MSERKTWFKIFRNSTEMDCTQVMLYDEIGAWGISAKEFCSEFNAIKTSKISVRINSGGGDAFDGIAICNAIKGHDAEVTCYIDGLAASAASVIAMGGDKVCMAKNAMMMVHDASVMAFGNSSDLRQQADMLDKLDGCIAQSYMDKSGKKIEEVRAIMDAETWFNADEAKEWGLVDEISEDDGDELGMAAAAKYALAKYPKAPPVLRRFAAKLINPPVKKETQMEKIVCRDGKYFLGDVEIDGSGLPAPTNEAAISKAANDAVEKERAYRSMFNTVVDTAKITGDEAKEFEKNFYGRAEADLKFLASHAIGTRAKPLGEGSHAEVEVEDEKTKSQNEIKIFCENRFAKDAGIRRAFRVNTLNSADPSYQAGLDRFIAVETKSRADWSTKTAKEDDENPREDRITQLMRNKSVFS